MGDLARGLLMLALSPTVGIWFWVRFCKKNQGFSFLIRHSIGGMIGCIACFASAIFIFVVTSPDDGARVFLLSLLSFFIIVTLFYWTRPRKIKDVSAPSVALKNLYNKDAAPAIQENSRPTLADNNLALNVPDVNPEVLPNPEVSRYSDSVAAISPDKFHLVANKFTARNTDCKENLKQETSRQTNTGQKSSGLDATEVSTAPEIEPIKKQGARNSMMNDTPYSVRRRIQERRTDRACAQLLGLVAGITADGHLHDMEIQFLRTWLAEKRSDGEQHWLLSQIESHIDHILADGVITDAERADLMTALQNAGGTDFAETGSVTADPLAFPADDCEVVIAGNTFCLTGRFRFGKRADCEAATGVAGGYCMDRVNRNTRYLVIGSAGATKSWKQASYGNKIETAMKLKENRHLIQIVTEEAWAAALA